MMLQFSILAQQERPTVILNKDTTKIERSLDYDSLEVSADIENARISEIVSKRKVVRHAMFQYIQSDKELLFKFELQVNPNGDVVGVNIVSTNTQDREISQIVMGDIKNQMKYSKLNIDFDTLHTYSVRLIAR